MPGAADPARLLIVWHSRTGAAQAMAQACAIGAGQTAQELEQTAELAITRLRACDATGQDLLDHQGYIFCAPENLASLAGEMKEFFDRCYYEALDRIGGRPYAAAVSAGTDGTGAARQMERICTGWRLRQVAPTLIARNGAQTTAQILAPKTVAAEVLQSCHELGGLLAATLLMAR
jgi:multimeric flavodoxin WrbA